jgi:hypothetical protein
MFTGFWVLKRDDALSGHHRILGQTIQLEDLTRLLTILIERISIAAEPPT